MNAAIELPAKLDHGAADYLHATLSAKSGASVNIDGSQVRRLGGLCAQVLLAASRHWRDSGHTFEVRTSEAMLSDLRRLGLDREILAQDEPA